MFPFIYTMVARSENLVQTAVEPPQSSPTIPLVVRVRLAQLSFTCRAVFFRKQLHEQLHERGRELCFGNFTMCLTL
jgi:hypothetical protein